MTKLQMIVKLFCLRYFFGSGCAASFIKPIYSRKLQIIRSVMESKNNAFSLYVFYMTHLIARYCFHQSLSLILHVKSVWSRCLQFENLSYFPRNAAVQTAIFKKYPSFKLHGYLDKDADRTRYVSSYTGMTIVLTFAMIML